ncbi:hypothetical protein OXX80_012930, partial [Metschnikowia pulcherrima]
MSLRKRIDPYLTPSAGQQEDTPSNAYYPPVSGQSPTPPHAQNTHKSPRKPVRQGSAASSNRVSSSSIFSLRKPRSERQNQSEMAERGVDLG